MGKIRFLYFFLFLVSAGARAQSIENVRIQISGSKVIAYFDLLSPNSDGLFATTIYSSYDNFNQPLKNVSGDAGIEITAGADKMITWDAGSELGNYNDRIALEIRARFYVPFVKLLAPTETTVFRRGKIQNIEWSGGSASSDLRIELYQDGQRLQSVATTPNTGVYKWNIPSNLKPGKDYMLRLSDSRNNEDAVQTAEFAIGNKFPTGIKAAGIVLVGAVIYFLIPDSPESEIPDPVGLPSN